jgi:hypothetical protein
MESEGGGKNHSGALYSVQEESVYFHIIDRKVYHIRTKGKELCIKAGKI